MPYQPKRRTPAQQVADQRQRDRVRAAREAAARPVEPNFDTPVQELDSSLVNEIENILKSPIVEGGINDASDDEADERREAYNQQSYLNDPVHDERFDFERRESGPLHIPFSEMGKIDIDGREYKLGWVTCRMGRDPHTHNVERAKMAGWVAVPISRLPSGCRSFSAKSDSGESYLIVNDAMLMMIPMDLYLREQKYQNAKSDDAMRRVERYADISGRIGDDAVQNMNLPRSSRKVFTGRYATASVQDALDQGGSEESALQQRQSPHAVRGFGPHR